MLSAKIKATGGGILGDVERVKACLGEAFPGIQFMLVNEPSLPAIHPAMRLLMRFLGADKEKFPHWEARFDGDQFIAVFNFAADPAIADVRLSLYGGGSLNAEPYLVRLKTSTGWQIRYPAF